MFAAIQQDRHLSELVETRVLALLEEVCNVLYKTLTVAIVVTVSVSLGWVTIGCNAKPAPVASTEEQAIALVKKRNRLLPACGELQLNPNAYTYTSGAYWAKLVYKDPLRSDEREWLVFYGPTWWWAVDYQTGEVIPENVPPGCE